MIKIDNLIILNINIRVFPKLHMDMTVDIIKIPKMYMNRSANMAHKEMTSNLSNPGLLSANYHNDSKYFNNNKLKKDTKLSK